SNLLDAYEEVMGTRPAPLCIGGATYARALPNAVAFGPVFPGDEEMCHQVDEYVCLERLAEMREIYRVAFDKICF
ncbi:MAG: dipeptidase PepV, partial [Clostridia bacterium]|nr:dipeptidase PepV [Clostridia bacterium]